MSLNKGLTGTKLVLITFSALGVIGLAGCHGSSNQGTPTADQKKAFAGVSDPAAQARDAQKFADFQRSHTQGAGAPSAPPTGH